jgi:hypothetical protein
LWTIAKEFDAKVQERDSFEKFWDSIQNAKKNVKGIAPPFKAKMLELNKARVNFKHYGNSPAGSDATKFLAYTEEFLRETTRAFFDKEFDEISLADLIKNPEIKKYIKEAEKHISEGNFKESVTACAMAEYIIMGQLAMVIPRVDTNIKSIGKIFGRERASDVNRIFDYLTKYLENLRNVSLICLLGLNLKEYVKYARIKPGIIQTMDGKFHEYHHKPNYSEDDAKFSVKYVTNQAITTQEKM